MRQWMPPVGGNFDERIENEAPPGQTRMRHGGMPRYRLPRADNVEIEHAVTPAATWAATEGALDGLEQGQQHMQG